MVIRSFVQFFEEIIYLQKGVGDFSFINVFLDRINYFPKMLRDSEFSNKCQCSRLVFAEQFWL